MSCFFEFPHFPVGLTVYYFNFIPEGAMVTLFLTYMVGYTRLVRFPSSYCFSMFFHPYFKRAACFALVNLAAAAWDGVYAVLGLVLLGLGVFLVLIHFWIPSWCCKGHISFEFFRRPLVCMVGRPLEVFASHFLHLLYSSFWWTVCYQGSCYVEGYFLAWSFLDGMCGSRYLLSVLGVVDNVRFHIWHCMGDGSRS